MDLSFSSSKPIGSVHKPRTIHVADLPPLNPDHVGGFKVAAATFAGIEHKFGLKMPRFNTASIPMYVPVDAVNKIAPMTPVTPAPVQATPTPSAPTEASPAPAPSAEPVVTVTESKSE